MLREHTIQSGENLSVIFAKLELSNTALHQILHSKQAADKLKSIRPGQKVKIVIGGDGLIDQLELEQSRIKSIIVSKSDSGYTTQEVEKELDRQVVYTHGVIETSLYLSAKKAGLSDKLTLQLENIFGWDIDFALSLRAGDNFTVMYEKFFLHGEQIRTGNILAAEFKNQGVTYRAVRYTDPNGDSAHYTPNGNSLHKAFLRSPVEFGRISSRFNMRRRHPVLNKILAHKGVDYAAPTGTPVRTTGDGKIIYRGGKGGYGRTVVVRHSQGYSTLYSHLSRYNRKQRSGSRVKQGDIIGFVGKSGLATGPHLHYEFRVNGVYKNPLTVKIPQSKPVHEDYLAEFKSVTQPLLSRLEKVRTVMLAQSE